MDYCDRWGVKTEKKKGTNASGGTSSCEYPWIDGAEAMHVCSFGDATRAATMAGTRLPARADLGIEVKFSCHDETLIQNPRKPRKSSAPTLILATTGTQYAIKARKGVIMTIGGFEFNR